MSNEEYTPEQIDAVFDVEDPAYIKLRYGDGETGWAVAFGEDKAIISNTPLEPRLCFKDVVEKLPMGDGDYLPAAGKVLWRYYAKKTGVRYDAPDHETAQATFDKICKAVRDAGLGVEGHTAGICGVSHHEDTDLASIFKVAAVEVDLCTDWQEDDG